VWGDADVKSVDDLAGVGLFSQDMESCDAAAVVTADTGQAIEATNQRGRRLDVLVGGEINVVEITGFKELSVGTIRESSHAARGDGDIFASEETLGEKGESAVDGIEVVGVLEPRQEVLAKCFIALDFGDVRGVLESACDQGVATGRGMENTHDVLRVPAKGGVDGAWPTNALEIDFDRFEQGIVESWCAKRTFALSQGVGERVARGGVGEGPTFDDVGAGLSVVGALPINDV